jgi:glyoxylase-like metal-dependent hydrolase (beta-lactamase superfamily II)
MLFRQLFDPETSTYSYLLADPDSRDAALIDGVAEQFERDCALLRELELQLRFTIETHLHADHVSSSGRMREALGCAIAVSAAAGVENADRELHDGDALQIGSLRLVGRATPGHTSGCMTYLLSAAGMAFTGDALLIRGCGRTDFQQGNPHTLFRSVRERILALPAATLLYPGHDYKGRTVTTVAEERRFNPRLGLGRSEAEFAELMGKLNLAYPKKLDIAVPANQRSGLGYVPAAAVPAGVAAARELAASTRGVAGVMESLGRQDSESWLGEGI